MTISKIDPAGLDIGQIGGRRNLIINGAMQVAQRGTSSTSITSGGYKTVDRWTLEYSSLGTWTQSQSTDVPSGSGFAYSLKMDCTTADASPSAGDRLIVNQRLEGQDLQQLAKGTSSAKKLTVSFWVKSSKTGTYIFELYDGDNTRQVSKSYTIDSANTWEQKTITIDGDTSGAFTNDANLSLYVQWWLGSGTTFTSGTLNTSWASATNANRAVGQVNLADDTANDWYITGVQLEVGTVATPFEHRSYGEELQLCSRYYQLVEGGPFGSVTSSVFYGATVGFSQMRATPTPTWIQTISAYAFPTTASTAISATVRSFVIYKAANATLGGAYFQDQFSLTAEL